MSQGLSLRRYLFGGAALPPGAGAAGRDLRIDLVRGLALLIIFINHMPGNLVAQWTPVNFGFSDAADAFVLLAGVSAMFAYGPVFERQGLVAGSLRIARRLRTLYLAHLLVFALVCGIVAVAVVGTQNPLYIEAVNIQPLLSDTPAALAAVLTLTFQPHYLDILPLYVVLLALFPLIHRAVLISPALTLAASIAIWQGALLFGLNLPNSGSAGWFFNPFAWQLLFTLGMVMGRAARLGVVAPRSRTLDIAAALVLLGALAIKLAPGNPTGIAALGDWIDHLQLGNDKTNLALTRVSHLAALTWLVIRVLPFNAPLLRSLPARQLATIGRHSLPVFCTGIVLSIAGQIILAETAFDPGIQLLVCACGIMLLAALGNFLTWHRSTRTAPKADGGALAATAS